MATLTRTVLDEAQRRILAESRARAAGRITAVREQQRETRQNRHELKRQFGKGMFCGGSRP